jgi:Protein of unknown function (DUF2911)
MNFRLTPLRVFFAIACTALLATPSSAQKETGAAPEMMQAGPSNGPLPSPAATANVAVAGATIRINYNTPSLRGRHLGGPEIVPYGQVWRTGANPATIIITSAPLKFGDLLVPAGTHTLYSLPTADSWKLILNNQTGQWGTEYKPEMDLGRIPMKAKPMTTPQEVMSLSFENTTATSTELHIRWEKTDEYVLVTRP